MTDRRDMSSKGRGKTGGRAKGVLNKVTRDVRELAQAYGPQVIEGLWKIFQESDSEASCIAAAKELLDRAYGRPATPVMGEASGEANTKPGDRARNLFSPSPKRRRRAALPGNPDAR
jgi:hypothetical protein